MSVQGYNTANDADALVDAVREIYKLQDSALADALAAP
jgi:hypothetical protein